MSSGKVKCTCGWSWNKSDSSKKDMYICHECGRDNSNNIYKAQDGVETPFIPYSNEYLDSLENNYLKLYNDPNTRMDDGYDAFYNSMVNNLPNVTRKAKGWVVYKPGTEIEEFTEDDGTISAPTPGKNRMVKRVEDYEISDRPNTLEQDKLTKYMQQRAINKLDNRTVSNKGYDINVPKQKNGGWLDNYNDSQASAPEGMEGDGFSNVGRNYSPAWGGQFQNGGKAPKYVESKNDPRYKAYQDSLWLYNVKERNKQDILRNNHNINNHLTSDAFERLYKLNGKYPDPIGYTKPLYIGRDTSGKDRYAKAELYKKPQQQVIVKPTTTKQTTKPSNTGWTPLTKEIAKGRYEGDLKNMVYRKKSDGNYDITYQAPPEVSRQPIQAIQNNLRPAGLVQGDFDIDADSEIQPEVRHAKSWKYNTREGKSGEEGYINSPEDMDYYTRLKDFYQTGAGKGLGNKVEITPQYQMGGSVYPVNYVPQAAMGGTIAGAVGFSYARTQGSAPSNGKYAKKTMASAQNGKEMQFYQNGLDFQPKTISKNGSWLSKYDVAQDGDILDKFRESHPSVRSIQNDAMNRKIQQSKGRGKETTVTQKDNTRTVTPKEIKKLSGKEQNELAQRQSEEQARKDWVQGSMEEAYKSPLMSPGYFTPEGALIGAMQGAFKMPGHIAEGDYKGAAIDALMALPIGIPAAKRLGRALGPEEGLIGKVSNELNINTSLSKIKKEGQLQGLSEHEIAKKQMEQVGITSNQRKAYTPIVSELAEKYIRPVGYGGSEGTKLSELIKHIKEGGYDPNGLRPERLDAWKLYLGRPQIDKTFSIADTAPALHPSYKPGSLEGMDVYNINSKSVLGNIPQYPRGVGKGGYMDILENPIATDRDHAIMGGYNKIMTKQGTQYNDIWDLEPSMSFRSLAPNKISESPLLENIFYKTNTEGVQVPRAVKIPVSKAFGKPFMSHGNLPYSSTNYVDDLKLALQGEIENIQPQANEWPRAAETMARWQGDIKSLENYPKFEEGGIIKDDRGQWDHPGEITEIGSNDITMEGVPYNVLGISDTGDTKLMKPGKNYKFKGKKVTEYPMAKNGLRQEQKGLQNLDQLTNFTNYNKPQPGGWLNKYN